MDISIALLLTPFIVLVASMLLVFVSHILKILEAFASKSRPLSDLGLGNFKSPKALKDICKKLVAKLSYTGLSSSMEFNFHDTMMMACLLVLVVIAISLVNQSQSVVTVVGNADAASSTNTNAAKKKSNKTTVTAGK